MGIDYFLLYPMRSMGESIGIGLEASLTSKGPQGKTTEPMNSTKVTYCSIQLSWVLVESSTSSLEVSINSQNIKNGMQ